MPVSNNGKTPSWRVSWIVYIKEIVYATLVISLWYYLAPLMKSKMILNCLQVGVVVGLIIILYRMYYTWTIRLYANDSGIWVYRGVFPWARGVYGMKWGDFEDCVVTQKFIYWLTNSHPVILRTRFSKNPEIYLPPIFAARKAAQYINNVDKRHLTPTK